MINFLIPKPNKILTLCPLRNFSCFLSFANFFSTSTFSKNSIRNMVSSECQTDWIQIRPDILSGLIWIQSGCKGYEQTTLVGKELTRQMANRLV